MDENNICRRRFIKSSGLLITGSLVIGSVLINCKNNKKDTSTGLDTDGENKTKSIQCPCHGSSFSLEGEVIKGPAVSRLPEIPSSFDGTLININSGKRIVDINESANQVLKDVQGAKKFDLEGETLPVIVIRISDSEVKVLSSRCTHQGCQVDLPL